MNMKRSGSLSTIYTLLYASATSSHSILGRGGIPLAAAFSNPAEIRRTAHKHKQIRSFTSTPIKMAVSDDTTATAPITNNPLTDRGLPSPLLLGSASFTRKLILSEMNIPYHKVVRPIDEKSLGDRSKDKPHDLVLTLALAKMDHLVNEIQSGNCENDMPQSDNASIATSMVIEKEDGEGEIVNKNEEQWIVLTGDQVVTHDGNILEKPESIEQAKEFVKGYATSPCSTVGSCVLTHLPTGICVSGVDTATIYFKTTVKDIIDGADLVDRMLAEDAPILSCAGGLMIEHPFVREHVERIDGAEDSVMGLSKALVERLLGELKEKLDECDQSD